MRMQSAIITINRIAITTINRIAIITIDRIATITINKIAPITINRKADVFLVVSDFYVLSTLRAFVKKKNKIRTQRKRTRRKLKEIKEKKTNVNKVTWASTAATSTRQKSIHIHQSTFAVSNEQQVYCILNNRCMRIDLSCGTRHLPKRGGGGGPPRTPTQFGSLGPNVHT